MKQIPHSLLLASLMLVAATIPAVLDAKNSAKPSGVFGQCINTGDARMGVMHAVMACYEAEISRQDKILNTTYQTVRKRLTPARQKELQILERRWITLRDEKCRAEAYKEGGRGSQDAIVIWSGCLIRETEQRTEWLKKF